MRYILDISYKGTGYHGWQIQANAHSVQAELNNALEKILRKKVETIGSGRTDTGVHAEQQIVQFDWEEPLDTKQLMYKLNLVLPFDISVQWISRVKDNFSARFDARARTYEYRIVRKKEVFSRELALYLTAPLDVELMNKASEVLLSYNDFQCFSKYKTNVDHFLCDMFVAKWEEKGDWLIFTIKANRFLRGMVRAIVGTLLEVGTGKMNLSEFEKVIESKDRKFAGIAVPAKGLFLTKVDYPSELFLETKNGR
jgi:tRNA pseudouridine38-40 synthase